MQVCSNHLGCKSIGAKDARVGVASCFGGGKGESKRRLSCASFRFAGSAMHLVGREEELPGGALRLGLLQPSDGTAGPVVVVDPR